MLLTKLSLAGNLGCHYNQTLPLPARESLVIDIPVGDGKIAYLFYSAGGHCQLHFVGHLGDCSIVEQLLREGGTTVFPLLEPLIEKLVH
jgi:hypothetical protein